MSDATASLARRRRLSGLLLGLASLILLGGTGAGVWGVRWARARQILALEHENDVAALAYAPGGDFLVSSTAGGHARVWSDPGGRLLGELELVVGKRQAEVGALAVSGSGELLAVAFDDGTVELWSIPERRRLRELPIRRVSTVGATYEGHPRFVTALSFSASDKRLAAVRPDGVVATWSTEDERDHWDQTVFSAASGPAVRFASEGALLIASFDSLVELSVAARSFTWRAVPEGYSLRDGENALAPDGSLWARFSTFGGGASGPTAEHVRLNRVSPGKITETIDTDWKAPVTFSADGELAVERSSPVRVHSLAAGRVVAEIPIPAIKHFPGSGARPFEVYAISADAKPIGPLVVSPASDRVAVVVGRMLHVLPFHR